jgi:RNA-directed DNA polymerase
MLHHVTPVLLKDSFYALKRNAAPGVDGVTWEEYEAGLEDRLVDLHSRVHRGSYRPQPSRRKWIPKGNGQQRPLAIAVVEDKVVQQAVATVLNAIEADFRSFSYGFRPGRSQHMALGALYVAIKRTKVNWILGFRHSIFFRFDSAGQAASLRAYASSGPECAEADPDVAGKPCSRARK